MRTVINFFDHLCFNFVSNTSVWIWLEVSLSVVNKWTVIIQMCWLSSCLCLRAVDCGVCGTVSQLFTFVLGDLHFHGVSVNVWVVLRWFTAPLLLHSYLLWFTCTSFSFILIVSSIRIVVHPYSFNHSLRHTYCFIPTYCDSPILFQSYF